MYMWVTFRITQENMSDAPPLSGRALKITYGYKQKKTSENPTFNSP